MNENAFEMILEEGEEIVWSSGVNVSAYVKKHFFSTFLFGLFPPAATLMLGIPYSWLILLLILLGKYGFFDGTNFVTGTFDDNILKFAVGHFAFSIFAIICFILILRRGGKNTYFCITNKRVIKRSGVFNNKFVHYSLRNIGTVEVAGGIFDSKRNIQSATLKITVKDFHLNTDGNSHPNTLKIVSLNNAYDAYKKLNEMTYGNNEVLRVKNEK